MGGGDSDGDGERGAMDVEMTNVATTELSIVKLLSVTMLTKTLLSPSTPKHTRAHTQTHTHTHTHTHKAAHLVIGTNILHINEVKKIK